MKSSKDRSTFLEFCKNKNNKMVKSAQMLMKSDQTVMLTNAGMNKIQAKFL